MRTCSCNSNADTMFQIYAAVMAQGLPNFLGAKCPLPSNFNFDEWDHLVHIDADTETFAFFKYDFPTSYQGPIPNPYGKKHASATRHPSHIKKYIEREVSEGDMLGPFSQPPFSPWCQTNPLLTRPKKESPDRRVIMDLFWPPPPQLSVNGGMHTFLGIPKKMHFPSAEDLCALICKAGKGCFMYAIDVSWADWQLPLDPGEWSLVCFTFDSSFFVDLSLHFASSGLPPTVKM